MTVIVCVSEREIRIERINVDWYAELFRVKLENECNDDKNKIS